MSIDPPPTGFDDPQFRPGAGIVIANPAGEVLVCERSDFKDSWQLPQGGRKPGEPWLDTAYREMWEETGIIADQVEFITELNTPLHYHWPKKKKEDELLGAVLKFFLFRYLDDPAKIDVNASESHEFVRHKWVTHDWITENVIYFRRPVYTGAFAELAKFLKP